MDSPILKFILIALTVIAFCFGIALVAIGGTIKNERSYAELSGKAVCTVAILTIVMGCLVMILSILGFIGALMGNKVILITYAVLTIIIAILLLALGIVALVIRKDLKRGVIGELDLLLFHYDFLNKSATATETFDDLQRKLDCCGTKSYKSWETVFVNFSIPISCCVKEKAGCGDGQLLIRSGAINEKGCTDKLLKRFISRAELIGYMCICVAILQIIGAIFAIILAVSSS